MQTSKAGLRAWIAWVCLAALCAPLLAVLVAAAGSGRAHAADPAGGPAPATAAANANAISTANAAAGGPAPSPSVPGAAPNFGAAVPSEQFVQNFQQQVTRQLQSALSDAREQDDARMREWGEQQRRATEQLLEAQRSIEQSRNERAGFPDESPPESSAPQVHSRPSPAGRAGASAFEAQDGHVDFESGPAPSPVGAVLPGLSALALPAAYAPSAGMGPGPGSGAIAGASAGAYAGASGRRNVSPHGFVEGRLLNGVVAVVGGPDRESIVALQGRYEGANGFTSNLDGCLALVQGHSDPAAGRIDFKLARLTCNFSGGASHTWDAAGWLVDADGIRGLRATLVSNAGAKAALAAVGGAIDGLGQRMSQEQYRASSSPLGTSAAFSGNVSRDALGGAASGSARSVAQAMADAYALFPPSLQVGGGTPVTVVLANDLRLPSQARAASPTFPATAQ